MALSKLAANSFDLTDNYALTGTVTGVISTQKLFLIKNIDASADSTISFVNGASSVVLDGTYKTYLFRLINIHPSNNTTTFSVNFRDGGSSYDATKTTTAFAADHYENGSGATLFYWASKDLAQSTSAQRLTTGELSTDNDGCLTGYLHLFNPSSTTFVKHFIARTNVSFEADYTIDSYVAGYFNTTADITAIQFKMSSGNIDSGDICLYGIL